MKTSGRGYRSHHTRPHTEAITLAGVAFLACLASGVGIITYILTQADVVIIEKIPVEANYEHIPYINKK